MPIAFEPPPTQAATTSGSRPTALEHLRAGLVADHPLVLAHHQRERVRAGDGAEHVVRGLDVGHPVAHRLVDRVLQRARAGGHRHDGGAEQLHPHDVERLPAGVLLAHVDRALQAHQRGRGRGGHAVLAGAGLGDDPLLADALGEQRLAQHIVDLVRAGVVEVLALEQHPRAAGVLAELRHVGQRRGSPGVVAQQPLQFGHELGIALGGVEGGGEFVDGGDERLGDEAAAELAEVAGGIRRCGVGSHDGRAPGWIGRTGGDGASPAPSPEPYRGRQAVAPFGAAMARTHG